jgi:hypothetical protein
MNNTHVKQLIFPIITTLIFIVGVSLVSAQESGQSGTSEGTVSPPTSPPVDIGTCPEYVPPSPNWCEDGVFIPGIIDENGCRGFPTCQIDDDIGSYVPGDVIVGFNSDVTEEQAKKFFESYSSKLIKWESHFTSNNAPKWGVVKVPKGEEQNWIEIFDSEEIIRYAELNGIVSIPDPNPIVIDKGQGLGRPANAKPTKEGKIVSPIPVVAGEGGGADGVFLIEEESETYVQQGLVSVKASKKLILEEKKLLMETPVGNKEVKIMPSVVSSVAINQLKLKDYVIELKDVGKPVYEVTGKRDVKIFGLFKAKMKTTSQINAETGIVEKTKKPWWSFLARG